MPLDLGQARKTIGCIGCELSINFDFNLKGKNEYIYEIQDDSSKNRENLLQVCDRCQSEEHKCWTKIRIFQSSTFLCIDLVDFFWK